jgi:hypothetical protein
VRPHGIAPIVSAAMPLSDKKVDALRAAFVRRVQARIEELGSTPRDVSLKAMGNPDVVRNLLQGHDWTLRVIFRIADALDLLPERLFADPEEAPDTIDHALMEVVLIEVDRHLQKAGLSRLTPDARAFATLVVYDELLADWRKHRDRSKLDFGPFFEGSSGRRWLKTLARLPRLDQAAPPPLEPSGDRK